MSEVEIVDHYTDLEETKIKVLETYLGIGMDYTSACHMALLNPNTVRNWLREGAAKPYSKHAALLQRCRSAVGQMKGRILKELNLTHMIGRPAEYKEVVAKETVDKDGVVTRIFTSIKVKDEIKPNPDVAKWMMEKRFAEHWGTGADKNGSPDLLNEEPEQIVAAVRKMSIKEEAEQLAHYAEQARIIAEAESTDE